MLNLIILTIQTHKDQEVGGEDEVLDQVGEEAFHLEYIGESAKCLQFQW